MAGKFEHLRSNNKVDSKFKNHVDGGWMEGITKSSFKDCLEQSKKVFRTATQT